MSDCCNPSGYGSIFGDKKARRDLRKYDRKGIDRTSTRAVNYLASRGLEGRSVLEVGGGIGALSVELLKAGADRAVNVELSPEYEGVATFLLEREGLANKVQRRLGDFVDVGTDLEADDVVMNRVICCYADMRRLMGVALDSSRRFVAASYPRYRLGLRIAFGLANFYCRMRGIEFSPVLHSPNDIEAAARNAGFRVVFQAQDFIWRGTVFERSA